MLKKISLFCLLFICTTSCFSAITDTVPQKDPYFQAKKNIETIQNKWDPIIEGKKKAFLLSLPNLNRATKESVANPSIQNQDLLAKSTQDTQNKQAALNQAIKAKDNELAPWKKIQTDLLNQMSN